MKTNYLLLSILAIFLCASMPEAANAQGGLNELKKAFGKKKKKKKGKEESKEEKSEPKKEVPASYATEADAENAKKLAKEYLDIRSLDKLEGLKIHVYEEPIETTKYLERTNSELETYYANDIAGKFLEKNKADMEKYIQIAANVAKIERNITFDDYRPHTEAEQTVVKYWSEYSNAYKRYKESGENSANTEAVEELWNRPTRDNYKFKTEGLKLAANSMIELAYEYNYENTKVSAVKMLKELSKTLGLFATMLPEGHAILAEVNTLQKDTKAAIKDIGGADMADVHASTFHENNVGKIFFSKKPIDAKTATAGDFTTDFTINDPIYAIMFLDTKLKFLNREERQYKMVRTDGRKEYDEGRAIYIEPHLDFSITLDDDNYMAVKQFGSEDEIKAKAEQAFISFALKPAELKATRADAFVGFANYISQKSPRTHEIKFEMTDPTVKYGSAIAEGKLSISLSGMDKQALSTQVQKVQDDLITAQQAMILEARGLPDAFSNASLYSHSFKPVSFAQVKALIEKNLKIGYDAAKVDAIVVQNENSKNKSTWEVKVNAFGVPLSRSGPGYYVAYTGTDGNCYHYYFYIFQKYQGNNKYGATTNGTPSGITPTQYNCENKKFAK